MQLAIAVDESSVGAAPNHVGRELAVQDIGVPSIVTGLEPGDKLVDRGRTVMAVNPQLGATGHITLQWFRPEVWAARRRSRYPNRCDRNPGVRRERLDRRESD